MTRQRYPFRPVDEPVPYVWPSGNGLAVYVAVNLEAYALDAGLLDELVPNPARPDVINYAWLDYGNRVGAWRLLEAMAAARLRPTALVNSALYEAAPGLVEAYREAGAEIVAHGRTNAESQAGLGEAEERALIDEATREIARREGAPPAGWLGPWIAETERTPDLLAEAGYRYLLDWCADDRPIPMATRAGPILAVPYPQEANDANAIVVRRLPARDFRDLCLDQIEEMRRQAAGGPLVCAISVHPHVIGQAHRLHVFRDVLERLASLREEIWLTTAGEIARVAAAGHALPAADAAPTR